MNSWKELFAKCSAMMGSVSERPSFRRMTNISMWVLWVIMAGAAIPFQQNWVGRAGGMDTFAALDGVHRQSVLKHALLFAAIVTLVCAGLRMFIPRTRSPWLVLGAFTFAVPIAFIWVGLMGATVWFPEVCTPLRILSWALLLGFFPGFISLHPSLREDPPFLSKWAARLNLQSTEPLPGEIRRPRTGTYLLAGALLLFTLSEIIIRHSLLRSRRLMSAFLFRPAYKPDVNAIAYNLRETIWALAACDLLNIFLGIAFLYFVVRRKPAEMIVAFLCAVSSQIAEDWMKLSH